MQTIHSIPLLALLLLCAIGLAGCVAPTPALSEEEQEATIEAIQTRVVEIRSTQNAAQPTAPVAATAASTAIGDNSATAAQTTPEQTELLAKLRPQGEAPELLNEVWLNSDPLKLADLRGQVVIVKFWTYG